MDGRAKTLVKIDNINHAYQEYKIGIFPFVSLWEMSYDKQAYDSIQFAPNTKLDDEIYNLFNTSG